MSVSEAEPQLFVRCIYVAALKWMFLKIKLEKIKQ